MGSEATCRHLVGLIAAEGLYGFMGGKWKRYTSEVSHKVNRMRAFKAYKCRCTCNACCGTRRWGNGHDACRLDRANLLQSPIYDLDGRYLGTRRDVLSRGTYVIGGKKVLVP
ncbi:MAG: hypothetical protein Q4A44_04175 [Bacteroidales bacterium]|nr:hypothetical protein [Bacteroidales bacterium]